MGCNCSCGTHSRQLDEIMASLPLRKLSYDEIDKQLKSPLKTHHFNIDDQTFQMFFNKNLISPTYPNHKDDLLNFWFNFYRNKPTKYQNVYIMFTFFFLSKNEYKALKFTKSEIKIKSEEMEYFKLLFKEYRNIRYGNSNLKFLSYHDLNFFLEDYIQFVTQTCLKHFSYLLDENVKKIVEWRLNDLLFGDNIVSNFIEETFFKNISNLDEKIDIQKFINLYWDLLKDESEIRRLFVEYLTSKNE
jgi:hypothetical protein